MKIVSLDFETANYAKNSAISIGLVKMEDGKVIDEYYSLIKPPEMKFDPYFITIHNLKPKDVEDAPPFSQIYSDISHFISDDLVVAHNAIFDMGILKETAEFYNLNLVDFNYLCTLRLAKKIWKFEDSYKLTSLAKKMKLEYRAHHALDDAYAAGLLFYKIINGVSDSTLHKFLEENGVKVNKFLGGEYKGSLEKVQNSLF